MSGEIPGLLRFDEAYLERVWGGEKLRTVLGKPTPTGRPTGEAWLVSDHPVHESVVVEGAWSGRMLGELTRKEPEAVLGRLPRATRHGRFPLLLKLLDSGAPLSVQVHPDDADAARLNEADDGKTEMWHVLEADAGAKLYCGLERLADTAAFKQVLESGTIRDHLHEFEAESGTNVFVSAGTVHAIGPGVLIAEIQQNSDLTYRIDDWGRMGADGKPRPLHREKALSVTRVDAHAGPTPGMTYEAGDARVEVLGACSFFAAETVTVTGQYSRQTRGDSFHMLLGKRGNLQVSAGGDAAELKVGEAVVIPGAQIDFEIEGEGEVLAYYVPDIERDIWNPLRAAGHSEGAMETLGGLRGK